MSHLHLCVFGGQYGSEGKGCVSEFLMKENRHHGDRFREWTVIGENAPNSGHTCSAGSVRSLPAASFFANRVMLGPDAVIDIDILKHDLATIQAWRATQFSDELPGLPGGRLEVHIHPHAAWLKPHHREMEANSKSVTAISSTGSGSGAARFEKYFSRTPDSVIQSAIVEYPNIFAPYDVRIQPLKAWPILASMALDGSCLFECSQGFMLDTNFGLFPHVTSRSTSPRVAVERNGFGYENWSYCAAIRTYPIRTGGPSGPTAGKEISFLELGIPNEIATVTKRIRRIFEFSVDDLEYMTQLVAPDKLFITHADYLSDWSQKNGFASLSTVDWRAITGAWWKTTVADQSPWIDETFQDNVWFSARAGQFEKL